MKQNSLKPDSLIFRKKHINFCNHTSSAFLIIIAIVVLTIKSTSAYSQIALNGFSKKTTVASENPKFISKPFESKVFIEEQGQFRKSAEEKQLNIPGTIFYAVRNAEFNAYFTDKGISFVFSRLENIEPKEGEKEEEEEEEKRRKHLVKQEVVSFEWLNPNPAMRVKAVESTSAYYTFGKFADKSQYNHVTAYKKLLYSNLYEGVDAEFELPEKGGLKYKFIVHAGYSIPSIAFKIKGAKGLYIDKEGNIHIAGKYNDLIDQAPVAFTANTNTVIPIKYNLRRNIVEFIAENQSPLSEDLIIDPWIIDPSIPAANNAYDIQEDSLGNVFVYGGTYNTYSVQKYNPAGTLQWTYAVGCYYYGDIAVANSGNVYVTEGITAKLIKLTPAGSVIYSITQGAENWRLSFNKSKTILSMGGNFSPNSLSKIDTTTGAMSTQVTYPSDTWAVATDCNGDIYSMHHGASPCIIRKTNSDFTPALSAVTNGFCVSGYSNIFYVRGLNALTISGPYLYIYDGLNLRRYAKNTLTFIDFVPVANGAANNCDGIAFDFCGNIYVGTMTTIEKFDMSLNHISSIPAPGIVYDLLLAGNGDLLASGNAFVANMGPTCPAPPQLTVTDTSNNASCKPGKAIVFAIGGTTPYSYSWQPGSLTNDTITGLTPGTYTYVVNDAFCQSYEDSVTVNLITPLSISQGTFTKENCLNSLNGSASVNAVNGTPPYSYSWNTNPVQTTQTATGLAAGIYLATVIDADSCVDTLSVLVPREPLPVANFGSTQVCNGTSTMFSDSTTAVAGTVNSWSWNFGDTTTLSSSQNPSHTYIRAGTHPATLIIQTSLGCKDTITKNVTVHHNPLASFTQSNVCKGDTMYFNSTSSVDTSSSISSYLWLFGESNASSTAQNPSHVYSFQGTYTVTLIITTNEGCKDTISKNVVVHPPPLAQFTTAANVCHGKYSLFTESSTIPGTDTIQSWQWNFNDGSPLLNQQQVTGGHLYAATGTYNLLLLVTSTFGCTDTATKTIVVRPKPIANFGSTKVCDGTSTVFSDSSFTASGTVNLWTWDFADGSPVNPAQNPSHLFDDAGMHAVTLIIQNNFGCADTVTKPVKVYFNPVSNFTVQDVCLKDSVYFTDSSYVDTSATVTTYLWVFNDGSPTSNLKNPSHLYANAGTYNVTLLSTTDKGCSNAVNKVVQVFDPPVTAFSVNDVCLFNPAVFVNSSTNPSMGAIASVLWSFGDGSLLNNTALNPNHLYTSTGNYPVSLITRSSNLACADTLTDTVTVFPIPVAAFSAQNVCLNEAMDFIDSSTVTNSNTITGWNWNFGDNSTGSTIQNPIHTYTSFGNYTVELIATTNNGCKDTITKTVIVHPLPTADFTTSNVCLGENASFTDQSTIPTNVTNDVISQWIWDFGDSSPVIPTQNTSYTYSTIGSYTVELKIISDFGCLDSISKTIVVNPNPQVIFTANDTIDCEPLCISFSDGSSVNPGTNTSWNWNMGDGTIISTPNANHCYSNDQEFAIKQFSISLTVTSDSGCVSSLTKNNYISVYPAPVSAFTVSPGTSTITDPVITLTNNSTGTDFWNWEFGDTDTSSLQAPSPHTYADTGSYIIRLVTTSQYGCTDTSYQTVVIEPDFMFYIPTAFSPNDDGINDTFTGKGMFFNEFEMLIFDRWGNLIYKTNEITKPWDGKANNGSIQAQKDVYIYAISVTDLKAVKHKYKGIVTLVR